MLLELNHINSLALTEGHVCTNPAQVITSVSGADVVTSFLPIGGGEQAGASNVPGVREAFDHITISSPEDWSPMLDTDALPIELEKAIAKHERASVRVEGDIGFGATTGGMAITRRYVGRLTEAVEAQLALGAAAHYPTENTLDFVRVVQGLPAEVIALSCLQACLHSVALADTQRDTLLSLGANIAAECWAHKLTTDKPRLAARISKAVRARHASVKYRRQAARSIAARAGFKEKRWPRDTLLYAGGWCWNIVTTELADVFEVVEGDGGEKMLTIRADAMKIADDAVGEVILRNPVFSPTATEPKPWSAWNGGGSWDARVNHGVTFLRSPYKDVAAEVRHAIKTGAMQPALDAVNTLQAVPWAINKPVLEVIKWCHANGVSVAGLPPHEDLAEPPKERQWEEMSDAERSLWKWRASETKKANRGFVGERVLFSEDMHIANMLAKHEAFYTPMNCDWRGRVYALSHFNFQREDRVRALFTFADGEPITEDGIRWLKIHLANCGDFGKISKRPLQERVDWVDDFIGKIHFIALHPQSRLSTEVWMAADKPFMFLAACLELSAALTAGPAFVTTLPVSFDGSCSGLQHLCAMTRAPEGALVNLTPSPEPKDVYNDVAILTRDRVQAEADAPEPRYNSKGEVAVTAEAIREVATTCLNFGIDRGLVKRNVMTYSYSSKKYGMSEQLREDVMKPLKFDVLSGKLEEHPFGHDDGHGAAKYLAGHIFDGIEELVHLPAEAMGFLQKLARALAHEGKPLRWTTPTGMPWINRYHAPDTKRVKLWLQDNGVKVVTRITVAVGSEAEIDKDKAANGVAPNFVHANDGAHLMLVANGAAREGITSIATVHDSFGCLASRATRFNQIIREQFVEMYQSHDVLAEVMASAKHDLTQANWNRLPPVVQYGNLDINEVLNATFAFA